MKSGLLGAMIFLGISLNASASPLVRGDDVWGLRHGDAAWGADSESRAGSDAWRGGHRFHGPMGRSPWNAEARMTFDGGSRHDWSARDFRGMIFGEANDFFSSLKTCGSTLYRDYDRTTMLFANVVYWIDINFNGGAYNSSSGMFAAIGAFRDLPFKLASLNTNLTFITIAVRPGGSNGPVTAAPGPQAGTGLAGLAAVGALAAWRLRRRGLTGAAAR